MPANEIRDTPGRLLLGWALLLTTLVILAWRIHLHPADYEWVEYPTALGDRKYYTSPSNEDRYEPNLRFKGHESGLYCRSEAPVAFDDAVMMKYAQESSGKHYVYQPATANLSGKPPVYLKTGENRYLEFGAKKFYRPYEPVAK